MLRTFTLISLILLPEAAFSSMTHDVAEQELAAMIDVIQNDLLGGNTFSTFEGSFAIVPKIFLTSDGKVRPNAWLTPVSAYQMGIMVNHPLLAIEDDIAILFTLAHELGHAYSETLLGQINCLGTDGIATEVIADLAAVLFLSKRGIALSTIDKTISQWRISNIFDDKGSGDHPPGAKRYKWISKTIKGLKRGAPFTDIVNDIVRNKLAARC